LKTHRVGGFLIFGFWKGGTNKGNSREKQKVMATHEAGHSAYVFVYFFDKDAMEEQG